jgi:hypothetical protein
MSHVEGRLDPFSVEITVKNSSAPIFTQARLITGLDTMDLFICIVRVSLNLQS